MPGRFDYFVLLAEMRTGSNFLESNLNAVDGLTCHGEAFNPQFIGYPNRSDLLGVTRDARDADPASLITEIRRVPADMGGFRFFHDHDARALEIVMEDTRCAKIILTRNPLESYVSRKIAQVTGQWKLTDVKRHKAAKARFDADEFFHHVQTVQTFQQAVLNRLQVSGQTAFYIAYEDLQSLDVINGLAGWLGVPGRLQQLDRSLKLQNPGAVTDKVSNVEEMSRALGGLDRFNLARTPNFEPRRGPAVPSFIATNAGLLYLPIPGGPDAGVIRWLADLDNLPESEIRRGMTQKHLRQWRRKHRTHRSFSVLRHPVERAHAVFCSRILSTGPDAFPQIRDTLRRQFRLRLPDNVNDPAYNRVAHRQAFLGFLDFVRANIAGQTTIRSDRAWASQSAVLASFAQVAPPDFVLRQEELPGMLPVLAQLVGVEVGSRPERETGDTPYDLAQIYDDAIEKQVSEIYRRDYLMFGFGPWKPDQAA